VNPWMVIGLALALSMDAFAVSVAAGVNLEDVSRRQTLRLAWHFGLFQALMPIVGWASGLTVAKLIQAYDHWIAFALLGLIGGRMVWAACRPAEDRAASKDPTRGIGLVVLSVATSIDALAVGFSLSLLDVSIWWPALVIGCVTAAVTAAGIQAGRVLGRVMRARRWAELIGGLVLIAIGVKILIDHGVLKR
jgi:putative Mn2+ efflux pump MntP